MGAKLDYHLLYYFVHYIHGIKVVKICKPALGTDLRTKIEAKSACKMYITLGHAGPLKNKKPR